MTRGRRTCVTLTAGLVLMGLLAGCAEGAPLDVATQPDGTVTADTSLRRPTTAMPKPTTPATLPAGSVTGPADAGKVPPADGPTPTDGIPAPFVVTGSVVTLDLSGVAGAAAEATDGQEGKVYTLTGDQAQQLTDLLAGWTFTREAVDATATPAAGWLWNLSYLAQDGSTALSLSLADANTLVVNDVRLNLTSEQTQTLQLLLQMLPGGR